MNRLLFLIVCMPLLLVLGCNNPTYVNVPGGSRDLAINDPNQLTVIRIQREALQYLFAQDPIPGDVVIKLPAGTNERVAFDLAADLSAYNVFPEGQTPSDEFRVVEVRSITARGGRGRVDIIRPGTIREREMLEVHMKWNAWDGWVADYLRVRNIDVDRIDPLLLAVPKQPVAPEVAPQPEAVPEPQAEPAPEPQPEPSTEAGAEELTEQPG